MLKFEIQTGDNVMLEVVPHSTAVGLGAKIELTFENSQVMQGESRWRKEEIKLNAYEVDELVTALQNIR